MSRLTDLLTAEARKRGLHGAEQMDPAAAFKLVREMPYRRASDRRPETTIAEWRGTCSGKHYLLQAVLSELGIESDLIACSTYVEIEPASLPDELGDILREGPVPDVHNYLRTPHIIDATWPLAAAEYGLPVNPEWTAGTDMLLPCTPILETTVPAGIDPQDFKNDFLREQFTESELGRRDRFFRQLAG